MSRRTRKQWVDRRTMDEYAHVIHLAGRRKRGGWTRPSLAARRTASHWRKAVTS